MENNNEKTLVLEQIKPIFREIEGKEDKLSINYETLWRIELSPEELNEMCGNMLQPIIIFGNSQENAVKQ